MSAEDRFRAAVNVIRNLPSKGSFQPSTDLQLKFYSYFKQATEGPCLVAKPSFWDVVGKAKWDAWKNLGNMPKEEAMENYVEELKQVIDLLKKTHANNHDKIIETMSYTESVSQFMDLLGPFYEVVPLVKSNSQPLLNGDKDIEENGGATVKKLNGFGEQAESDGEEFSDTYDNIKESVAALASVNVGKNGGGDNGYSTDECLDETNNNRVEGLVSSNGLVENLVNQKDSDKCKNDKVDPKKKRRDSSGDLESSMRNHQRVSLDRALSANNDNELDNMILQARGGADQNAVIPRSSVGDIATSAGMGANRGARSRNPRDTSLASSSDLSRSGVGAGGSGPPGGNYPIVSPDINAQLALVVIKLQNSLDEVNTRLAALENTLPNAKSKGGTNVIQKIFGISPNLLILILVWPFVATFLMKASQRRHQS